jgi:hypothetical protein
MTLASNITHSAPPYPGVILQVQGLTALLLAEEALLQRVMRSVASKRQEVLQLSGLQSLGEIISQVCPLTVRAVNFTAVWQARCRTPA